MNRLATWKTRLRAEVRFARVGQAVTRGVRGLRAEANKIDGKLGEWVRQVDHREVRAHRRSRVWRQLDSIRREKTRPPRGIGRVLSSSKKQASIGKSRSTFELAYSAGDVDYPYWDSH